MPSSKVTISLPTELLEQADRVRRQQHYTRSEFFREALRLHLFPTYTPALEEVREIDLGLAEVRRGEFVEFTTAVSATLDRLADRGCLTRASQPKQGWVWSPPSLGLSADAAGDLLDELRDDR